MAHILQSVVSLVSTFNPLVFGGIVVAGLYLTVRRHGGSLGEAHRHGGPAAKKVRR